MRYVVLVAVAGWVAFTGGCLAFAMRGHLAQAVLAQIAALLTAGCLWVLGNDGYLRIKDGRQADDHEG